MSTGTKTDILIVGAGPTGLVLAISLVKNGISTSAIRIIDKAPIRATTSRAIAVQARTLELYRSLDLAEELIPYGYKLPAFNLWARGKHQACIHVTDIGAGVTPYPFIFLLPQDTHEAFLEKKLKEMGISVERGVQLTSYEDQGSHLIAKLNKEIQVSPGETNFEEQICETTYLVGCDGSHSAVRHGVNISFEGGEYRHLFYVADIEFQNQVDGGHSPHPTMNGEAHLAFNGADFVLIFPYDSYGHARLVGTLPNRKNGELEIDNTNGTWTFEDDVAPQVRKILALDPIKANWFSTYRVHHRVADSFRRKNVFIAGDAAHIHSPVGGQGMNTGIGDAINLAWKLASALRGAVNSTTTASDTLLESYDVERRAFARRLVSTTDQAFTYITAEGLLANTFRNWIVPTVVPAAFSFRATQLLFFKTASQTLIHYRNSPITRKKEDRCAKDAGTVQSGDRLPWVSIGENDNYDTFKDMQWQVHIYGSGEFFVNWCQLNKIKLHVFDWDEKYRVAGLGNQMAYLLRPDQYVACAVYSGDETGVERMGNYLQEKGLKL